MDTTEKKSYSQMRKEHDAAILAFFEAWSKFEHKNKEQVNIVDLDVSERKSITKFINLLL